MGQNFFFSSQLIPGKMSPVTHLKSAEPIYRLTPALGLLSKALAENYAFSWRTPQARGGCGWEKA